jgi:hypothetical protein
LGEMARENLGSGRDEVVLEERKLMRGKLVTVTRDGSETRAIESRGDEAS